MRQNDERPDQPGDRGLVSWLSGRLDPGSGVPISLQLADAVDRAILHGQLRPGDSLPTVRDLAGGLRVAPNTVSRALGELARRGLTESRAGAGTVVTAGRATVLRRQETLRAELRELLLGLRQSGLSGAELHTVVGELLTEVEAAAI